jgi:type I restriction enzyme, S subunit
VIDDLRPYPAYTEVENAWLGPVPDHWELLPGRACYREKKVSNLGMAETTVLSLSYGRIVIKPGDKLRGLVPESFETYQIVDKGDIIIRPTDLQNDWNSLRVGLSRDRGIITSAYICLATSDRLSQEFGYLLLNTYDLRKVFYGLGSGLRQNLGWRDFKYLPCLVPPAAEQDAIVRFVTYADRRIRRYIRAKQTLVKLLEEQKKAIIHRAVTRGLDSNVRFKPSGVEWLGDVPEHWQVRAFTRCVSERADYRGATPTKVASGVFLVTAKNIRKGWIDYNASAEFVSEADYPTIMRRGLPRKGDLLITTEAPLGNAALVDREDVALAQRVIRFRMNPRSFEPDYVLFSVLSPYFQDQLQSRGTGSTALGIKASKLPQLQILCPPIPEQREIVASIHDQTEPLEGALDRAQREISLLHEYRTSLISDVVTGKLDVRDAAARLPDEADDPRALDDRDSLVDEEIEADLDEADDIAEGSLA